MRHPDHIGAEGLILLSMIIYDVYLVSYQTPSNFGLIMKRFCTDFFWILVNPYLQTYSQVVLVDNKYAAIGGIDLCYGRWDTHTHPLADVHPTNLFKTLFPGQDYNNARIMDFSQVNDYVSNTLSMRDYARMPWHDVGSGLLYFRCPALLKMNAQVHMTLTGNVVLDIAQHFIERWNNIKRRKV